MKRIIISAILLISWPSCTLNKNVISNPNLIRESDNNIDNSIIDFDEDYLVKYGEKNGIAPLSRRGRLNDIHRYTIVNNFDKNLKDKLDNDRKAAKAKLGETSTIEYVIMPIELTSTTENNLEASLAVIPLSTTKNPMQIEIKQTVTLPSSTQETDTTTDMYREFTTTTEHTTRRTDHFNGRMPSITIENDTNTQYETTETSSLATDIMKLTGTDETTTELSSYTTDPGFEENNETSEIPKSIKKRPKSNKTDHDSERGSEDYDVPLFTELDMQEQLDVPEDYYDGKDVIPTSAPKTDPFSVLVGIAGSVVGSVVENVAEKVVPKGLVDLIRRVRHQNEMLEAERLRSREENGGIGQFGRGILKSISSGITKPLSQFMAGVRDAGSLDHDQGFVSGVASGIASGVTSVANVASSVVEQFKDRVQAIYPGTVWCGDGRSATARSSDLGLFFFTDTCCRQHDACKMYIKAGDTKYGLTNTGLFTRSHCSCDNQFRSCLRKTNSLVSTQIGLTYFNVLGPQCFRKAHPIVKCVKRTRLTGQKCEEYELDITKPKMWQWFDNLTF